MVEESHTRCCPGAYSAPAMRNKECASNRDPKLGSERAADLDTLIEGFRFCARSEAKSPSTIALAQGAVRYLRQFLTESGLSTDIADIGTSEIRRFIIHLQQRQPFTRHRFTRPQPGHLSGHTVNSYLRALRLFWSWAASEGYVTYNPFSQVKIPKAPKKVMPTFTTEQLQALFRAIDASTPTGFRDYTVLLVLLDTAVRCSELTDLRVDNVNLESGWLKVRGKGTRERIVPFASKVQHALWKYLNRYRPEPAMPDCDHLFLTHDGRPLTKDRLEKIMKRHERRAGITGVRCSPHTMRHTAAIRYLRHGGDVFTLQRLMGHSTLDALRIYVNMAFPDVKEAHRRHSPADNIDLKTKPGTNKRPKKEPRNQR